MKYVKSVDDAREVVQKVFIKLFEKREKLEIKSSLKPYLFKSVYNTCLNEIRGKKSFLDVDEIDQLDLSEQSDKLVEAEEEKRIWAAINDLPTKCRDIFIMNRFDGLKNQEIADKLDISKRTVEVQISNALKKLRDKLLNIILLAWI